jgi:hypothetical protein
VPNTLLFLRYLRRFIQKRRIDPQNDLVSALIQAEEAGDRLTPDELMAMVMLLLVAGHETTVNLIGSGVLALLEHPEQMEKLRRDPGLIKPAVEELLRFTSPVEWATERYAREDVTIGAATIPRGAMVYVALASANRDDRQFTKPDALDITREPNKHLSFGLGPHFCLGAPLARLEGQLAINTLLRRLPDLRLATAPNQLRWRRGLLLRGLEALPVAFRVNARNDEAREAEVTALGADQTLARAAGATRLPPEFTPTARSLLTCTRSRKWSGAMTLMVISCVTMVALAMGISVGLRRGPIVGIASGAGVLAAGALGYFALLALALPM